MGPSKFGETKIEIEIDIEIASVRQACQKNQDGLCSAIFSRIGRHYARRQSPSLDKQALPYGRTNPVILSRWFVDCSAILKHRILTTGMGKLIMG